MVIKALCKTRPAEIQIVNFLEWLKSKTAEEA